MASTALLDTLTEDQLRALARELIAEVTLKQSMIEKLTHENALLKRLKFGARTESYSAEQRQLFEETLDADLAALEQQMFAASPAAAGEPKTERQAPTRAPLHAHLPRREIRHEPNSTQYRCDCQLKRIGEDVSEKLDYPPASSP